MEITARVKQTTQIPEEQSLLLNENIDNILIPASSIVLL
jgi:hypothetical protein